jgi:hypothetical protein
MATLKKIKRFFSGPTQSHSQETNPLLPADSSYMSPEEFQEFKQNSKILNLNDEELDKLQSQLAVKPDVQSKEKLRAYIENLYHHLNETPDKCFVSGAFVIADSNKTLHELLLSCITLNLTALKLESHAAFKTGKHKNNKDQKIYENWMLGNLTYMMECKCNGQGEGTQRPARNVKWYQFTGLDGNSYIYMKLEDWPTLHPMHLGQAVLRYVLKKPNESCVQPRREDCKRTKRESHHESHHESTRLISGESAEACHIDSTNTDEPAYGRVGDEYFVEQDLNTKILSEINLSASTGGRKTRKHKRKTLKLKLKLKLKIKNTQRVRRHRSNMRKKLKKYSRRK